MLKIRQLHGHLADCRSPYLYYIPELEGNESCIVLHGHHAICDGLSGFQAYHMMSDDPKYEKPGSEYPFLRIPKIPLLYWIYLYITYPWQCAVALKFFWSRPPDLNCIRKYATYMDGQIRFNLCKDISLKKCKAVRTQHQVGLNELILAVTSKVLKQYFVSKGDSSDEITLTMPIALMPRPESCSDYKYHNEIACACIYIKLKAKLTDAI